MNTKKYSNSVELPRNLRERLLVELATMRQDRHYSELMYGFACPSITGKIHRIINELNLAETKIFKELKEL